MKKEIIFIWLFLSAIILQKNDANAQNYVPFPDSGAIWINSIGEWLWQPGNPIPTYNLIGVKEYCMPGIDTSINSNTYSKLFVCGGNYKGAIRDNNHKIMFVPSDSLQEYLLYDFSAQPGDTIQNIYREDAFTGQIIFEDLILPNIGNDSVQINGVWRLRMAGVWISGVGNHQGLFMEHWPNVSNYQLSLECMSILDTTYYPIYATGACPTIISKVPQEQLFNSNPAFPNPSQGKFHLMCEDNDLLANCSLRDIAGKIINVTITKQQKIITVDLNDCAEGIYFFRIHSSKGIKTTRLVKVN